MNILLTNDDGIFAPGLAAIYKKLTRFGSVTVVAPSDSQSGASHSITFAEPLACQKVDIQGKFVGYSVQGSPADCVKLAYMQLHEGPIDLVVAGINAGANVGINVYYSGTVAAAMEGAFLQIPAVALSLSLEEKMDFDTAADHSVKILERLMPIDTGQVININIPWLSCGEPKGVCVVGQSTAGFEEKYIPTRNERGQTVFQLAGGQHRDTEHPVDTTCLTDGYITVTSLIPDMTHHKKTENLRKLLESQDK